MVKIHLILIQEGLERVFISNFCALNLLLALLLDGEDLY